MDLWKFIASSNNIGKVTPAWVKSFIREHFSVLSYDREMWRKRNPYDDQDSVMYGNSSYPYTVGIISEFSHYHCHYIAACRELEISYKVLDISRSNWIDAIKASRCDAYLIWPSAALTIWKQMFDDRLNIVVEELNKIIYPSYKELWLYENKRRMRDWLIANNIPHPKTDVFYEFEHAMEFLEHSNLPVVAKTSHGAASHGVIMLRDRSHAEKYVRKAFNEGIVVARGDKRDRQWGSVILQEYVPDAKEWRMVRIGNSYFGHQKGMVGEYHSGTGKVIWQAPSADLLDFLRKVTDAGGFTSMDLDVFETSDGRYLVNELQTVFGASYSKDQLRVNGEAGRYIQDLNNATWKFEKGDFARNACANLRVEHLLSILERQRAI